jgi:butyrate kinase
VEIIRLQEGVAIEQRLKVTEGMHDEDEEDCEVERLQAATEESLARKVAEHEANERGRVPELHAVRAIDEREQGESNDPGDGTNVGAHRAGRALSSKNQYGGEGPGHRSGTLGLGLVLPAVHCNSGTEAENKTHSGRNGWHDV